MSSFDSQRDLCLGFFQAAWEAGVFPIPEGGTVLELGCAEADWLKSMREARPDLRLTGIDQRDHARPAADRHVVDDILTTPMFRPAEFDAIVAVSMIEWAGLGHYGDRKDEDGDIKTMARARTWIKPGGLLYLDVPYTPDACEFELRHGLLRAYGENGLRHRLCSNHWREVWRQHFAGEHPGGGIHPDGPYVALVLKPL